MPNIIVVSNTGEGGPHQLCNLRIFIGHEVSDFQSLDYKVE